MFNIPLIIVDFIGTANLPWGNQCHMTMVESMTLSFFSLLFMIWEGLKRDELLTREQIGLKMDKFEALEEDRSHDEESKPGPFDPPATFHKATPDASFDNVSQNAPLLKK